MKKKKKTTKAKPKKTRAAKGCLCPPQGKPLFPVGDHVATCPISKRYTVNGRIIADMMHSEKMRGKAKDYVILSGATLMDFNGTYEIRRDDGVKPKPTVYLAHKKNLHKIIGAEQAARFWRPGFGRVRNGG